MGNRPPEEIEIIARLCRADAEFDQLWKEHEVLDRRVTELEEMRHLTADEEIELKRIKKIKLQGKDKLEAKIRSCKTGASA